MNTLYNDWLSCMNGGVRPVLSTDTTSCFYRSLEATYTMAFAPMLVEARGEMTSMGYYQYYGWGGKPIDYDHDAPPWSDDVLKWLKISQMADYAKYCLSSYVDSATLLFLNTIDIWKGAGNILDPDYLLADSDCPMNQQWMPQAFRFGTKYTELSSLQGTDMQPWWSTSSNKVCFGDPSFDGLRYTVYNGPYLPSKMNHKWYDASWRALCKLLNTPSIAIGGSQKGWYWINPLFCIYGNDRNAPFQLSSFAKSSLSSWQKIEDVLEPFDQQICGG